MLDDQPAALGAAEAKRLEELRLTALELRNDAELACGRHDAVVAELETLTAEEPYRERFLQQRMLALYRCGRQADALEVYRDARETLAEDLGLDPSPALQELERAILRQDPSLAAPEAPTRSTQPLPVPPTPLVGRRLELGFKEVMAYALAAFARLCLLEDDPARAAYLAGISDRQMADAGLLLQPSEQALFDEAKAALEQQLGDEFAEIHDAAMAAPLEESLRQGGVLAQAPASP